MERILSISLDADLLAARQKLLEDAGYAVVSANGFREAVQRAKPDLDLIVVGHTIPQDEKRRIIQELRKRGCEAPVLGLFCDDKSEKGDPSSARVLASVKQMLKERERWRKSGKVSAFQSRSGADRRKAIGRRLSRRAKALAGIVSPKPSTEQRQGERRSGRDRRNSGGASSAR
jgi:CheY-like chemotaxis protein